MFAHNDIALCCTSSKDGRFIYTGGNDQVIKVWQARKAARAPVVMQSESLQGRLASRSDDMPCLLITIQAASSIYWPSL